MKKCLGERAIMTLALAMMVAGAIVPVHVATASDARVTTVASMNIVERDALEREITKIANKMANSKSYFEADNLPIHIKASFDPVAQSLVMAIDERFGPVSALMEMEELQFDITQTIWPMLEKLKDFHGLDWRYGGKDLYFWFPEERVEATGSPKDVRLKTGPGSVLISDGHGYYYHHGYADWRFQRAPVNGIIEDKITSIIATPLWAALMLDGVDVKVVRDSSFGIHLPSGKPLYLMAARYLLQQSIPDRPDIWHSLPENTTALREYREDIRARPLYANALGVDALISIHTNASENAGVRGTRAVVQRERPESEQLASMALCYMQEHIHAQPKYEHFPVVTTPILADKGENRLATMPSVIIEVGFHTNIEDAAALQDPLFIGSATQGIAKGYRLYRAGEGCDEFTVRVGSHAEGFVGDIASFSANWAGHPVFPIRINSVLTECGDGVCEASHAFVPEANDEKQADLAHRCTEDDAKRSPFALTVTANDADNIQTKSTEIMISCFKRPEGVKRDHVAATINKRTRVARNY